MSSPTTNTDRPFVLVVGLDLADTDSSGYALDQAARTAMRIGGSRMHLLHVLAAEADADKIGQAAGLLREYVSGKAKQLGGLARQSVGIHIRRGRPGHEIAQLASDVDADLIVVGMHHRPHIKQLFLGSTAEHVMATAQCPVFVAGPRPAPKPSHVIAIEPPCPDCLRKRQETKGASWWCDRHSESHHLARIHRYSYQTELPFEQHDSEVIPTGV
jgi:nucleotide-binding universal stress UspA family protein